MNRILSPWCKEVKKTLIDRDMTVTDLADRSEISRPYVSGVVNGRVIAPEIAAKISDILGIKTEYSAAS
ncbi:MAG: helix-turn-helix domain-containing protein [Lachnospiraceae bacterium]|nr:helix-turn-helix domain-containing protein [Lachnospiraceae bacterium]